MPTTLTAGDLVSANLIAARAGDYEPQRTNNFTLVITAPSTIASLSETIQLCLSSFQIPKEENTVVHINFGNEERKVAGRATYAKVNLVVTDYVTNDIAGALKEWCQLVYTPTDDSGGGGNTQGRIGWAANYKGEADIYMFGPDGLGDKNETPLGNTRIWHLYGMWPVRFDPGEPSMENPEVNRITVEFEVDYMLRADESGPSGPV